MAKPWRYLWGEFPFYPDITAPDVVEPRRYWWARTTDKPPLWLCNLTGQCAAGWLLETVRCEEQADGRWHTEVCWQRRDPWQQLATPQGQVVGFCQIYGKAKPMMALRLLLWWALSYPIDKEA